MKAPSQREPPWISEKLRLHARVHDIHFHVLPIRPQVHVSSLLLSYEGTIAKQTSMLEAPSLCGIQGLTKLLGMRSQSSCRFWVCLWF
jgi:hypothetical protein